MQIRKSTLLQVMLIYLLLTFTGGILVYRLSNVIQYIEILIVCFGVFLFAINKQKYYEMQYGIYIIIVLLISVLSVRLIYGGVGLNTLLEYSSHIFLVLLAICVCREYFIERFINIIYAIAVVSIVCFFVQMYNPNILKSILGEFNSNFSYNDWSGFSPVVVRYRQWGTFIYTMREHELHRNLGVFSEPGNYQIILNSGLFILLFLKQKLEFSKTQYIKRVLAFFIAILTCQSTTGYIIMMIMLMVYVIENKNMGDQHLKRTVVLGIMVAILFLIVDYNIRNDASLWMTTIGDKIFTNGNLDMEASTGIWRIGAIGASFQMMISNPFGRGFDNTFAYIQSVLPGAAGGALFSFGAALGVIPFISVIVWTLYPIFKSPSLTKIEKWLFVFMYGYISVAQSKIFQPALISIPLWLFLTKGSEEYD